MAILMRRGAIGLFDSSKILPGELSVTTDKGELYYCYASGKVKKVATVEELQEILNAQPDAYQALLELVQDLNDDQSMAATLLAKINQNAKDILELGGSKADKEDLDGYTIYRSVTTIGLTPETATLSDILNAMSSYSILYYDLSGLAPGEIPLPSKAGEDLMLEIRKQSGNAFSAITLIDSGSNTQYTMGIDEFGNPSGEWTEIGTGSGGGQFSVITLGAAGDGVTDDSDVIEMAFSGSYPSVYLPAGVYLITRQINVGSNVHVYGDGATSIIRAKPGAGVIETTEAYPNPHRSINILDAQGASNILFQDFCIDGNKEGYDENPENLEVCSREDHVVCFEAWDSSNVRLEGMTIINSLIEGVYIYRCSDVIISNCIFAENGFYQEDASGLHCDASSKNITITNCISRNNGFHGFLFSEIDGLAVSNCVLDSNGYEGILLQYGAGKNVFSNLIIKGNGRHGIRVSSDSHNVILSGAQILSNKGHGISLNGVELFNAANLRITDNVGFAVYIYDSDNTRLDNLTSASNRTGDIFIYTSRVSLESVMLDSGKSRLGNITTYDDYGTTGISGTVQMAYYTSDWNIAYQNPYTDAWIEERRSDVSALLRQGDCILFAVNTDLHVFPREGEGGRYDQARDTILVAKAFPLDYICFLGDIIDESMEWEGREPRTWTLRGIYESAGVPWFATRGNHDFNSYGTDEVPFTTTSADSLFVTARDWHRNIVSKIDSTREMEVVGDPNDPTCGYYYVDDYTNKHRMIFVLSNSPIENNGRPYIDTESSDCYVNGRLTKKQLNWLVDSALDMTGKTDWIVSFYSHQAPYTDADEEDTSEFHGYGQDYPELRKVIKAFQTGTQANASVGCEDTDTKTYVYVSVTKNFASQGAIAVAGWFSGHVHDDCYKKVDGLNIFVSTNTFAGRRYSYSNDPNFTKKPPERNITNYAMSMNLVCINKDTRTVNVIKLGSKRSNDVKTSSDYSFTY